MNERTLTSRSGRGLRMVALGALTLVLAACRPGSDLPPLGAHNTAAAPGSTCGADAHFFLVGRHRDVLEVTRLPGPARIIGPGMAVTMDHVPARINVVYGADGVITRVYCG